MSDGIPYTPGDLVDHHGVSAIIKNDKGQLLMQKHNKYGFWTVPVGKANLGEDFIEGLKIEVFEETNLKAEDCQELIYKVYQYVRDGIPVKVYTHVIEVMKYSGELQNKEPHKHSEQKFMDIEEIVKLPYLSDTTLLYLASLGIKREPKL